MICFIENPNFSLISFILRPDGYNFYSPAGESIYLDAQIVPPDGSESLADLNFGKTTIVGQQKGRGNETPPAEKNPPKRPVMNEPLINEIEAAKFLGISRMTLLRRRNAGEIGFFRVGFRVLYSKEKHLIPFLETCEK